MEAMSFVTEDRKTAQESTYPNTYTFDLFGGVDVSLIYLVPGALLLLRSQTFKLFASTKLVLKCAITLAVEIITVLTHNAEVIFLFPLKLLVEILMRPTLTMQKKKPKSKCNGHLNFAY